MTILFTALLLDILLGEAPDRLHPVCFMGRWAHVCESFFRTRCPNASTAGALAALSVLLPFTLAGAVLPLLAPDAMSTLVAGVVVYVCLAPRSLAQHAEAVAAALERADLPAARLAVSRMVGRETEKLDAHGVARACVESVGENLVDGVLASLFWASAGLLLSRLFFESSVSSESAACAAGFTVLHRAANTLDAMWGKRNERYRHFGTVAARLDDILAYIPARLSLPTIAVAAWTLHGLRQDFFQTLRVGFSDRYAHPSPNSAWSEAAFAGALNLRLSGPLIYNGVRRDAPFIGVGTPDATPAHIHAAVRLMWRSTLLFALLPACMQQFSLS